MSRFEEFLRINKDLVKFAQFEDLVDNYNKLTQLDFPIDMSRLFKELFIHACFYDRLPVAQWLYQEVYLTFSVLAQIGLRPVFNYCHHFASRRKYLELAKWLEQIQMETKIRLGLVK